MAEDHRAALIAIALEVHNLLQRRGVPARYVQNIRDWIKTGGTADRQRKKRNQPTSRHLAKVMAGKTDEPPERQLQTADFDGPAPLYERPPWSVCQCYAATAVVHDTLVEDLRSRTIRAVELICPDRPEYLRFRMLTVKDEGGVFFDESQLDEVVLRKALRRVQDNLVDAGLLEVNAQPAQQVSSPADDRRTRKQKSTIEKHREQRNKFSKLRRAKGKTWHEIYIAYYEKYPGDRKASPDTLRLSFERNKQCE